MGAIGKMLGEHGVQALCSIVACAAPDVDGIKRTMIGGCVLDDFGGKNWERWRGTIILIPRFIDTATEHCNGWMVSDLMKTAINRDVTADEMRDRDSFWKSKWRAAP